MSVVEVIDCLPGESRSARGHIDKDMEVFRDHFPEFPVLPGVLALQILKEEVEACEKVRMRIVKIQAVKFQHFLKPGEAWESRIDKEKSQPGLWKVRLQAGGRTAVSARLWLEPEQA